MRQERPILFSAPMVRAILADKKTQTRRVVKLPPWGRAGSLELVDGQPTAEVRSSGFFRAVPCRYGAPGDDLWVRETWAYDGGDEYLYQCEPGAVCYRASYNEDVRISVTQQIIGHVPGGRWRPSIHMPRWASRIDLRVRQVRVERLHDITEDDAKAEGIRGWSKDGSLYKFAPADHEGDGPCWAWVDCPRSARDAFTRLWREINGRDSWDANPLVWRVEFWRVPRDG